MSDGSIQTHTQLKKSFQGYHGHATPRLKDEKSLATHEFAKIDANQFLLQEKMRKSQSSDLILVRIQTFRECLLLLVGKRENPWVVCKNKFKFSFLFWFFPFLPEKKCTLLFRLTKMNIQDASHVVLRQKCVFLCDAKAASPPDEKTHLGKFPLFSFRSFKINKLKWKKPQLHKPALRLTHFWPLVA